MKLLKRTLATELRALSAGVTLALAACLPLSAQTAGNAPFHFTVTSDLHDNATLCTYTFDAINAEGGPGAFMISIGDLADHNGQTPQNLRDLIDAKFGAKTIWWPVPGNHDTGSTYSFDWLRNEFSHGNKKRPPLKDSVLRTGPDGSTETTYSFDHGNVHFVLLNEYWNGETAPGSDYATKGDIVPALRAWLEADLQATDKPYIFVFGHEPAIPLHRHVGNSLDQYPENRDAFWALLARYKVQAFFSGHIHYYYKALKDGVYQISDGAAGKNSEGHQTFLKVNVDQDGTHVEAWQNETATPGVWHKADTIELKPRAVHTQP